MSTVLLDTHVWLWMVTSPARLSFATRELVGSGAGTRLLSAASVWEIAIKHAVGRLPLPQEPVEFVPDRVRTTVVDLLSISSADVLEAGALPRYHADPFDRLLVAQARLLGVPLVTADPKLGRYDVEVVSA